MREKRAGFTRLRPKERVPGAGMKERFVTSAGCGAGFGGFRLLWDRKPRGRRRGGFTLIEILIAIFVMLVGVLGIMALFPVGLHSSQLVQEKTAASMAARSALSLMERSQIAPRVRMLTGNDATKFPYLFPSDFVTPTHVIPDMIEQKNLGWTDAQNPPKRLVSTLNPQYSWDARFYLSWTLSSQYDTPKGAHRVSPNLYEVMVTVYRNYTEYALGNITMQVDAATGKLTDTMTYVGSPTEKPKPSWWVRPYGRGEWYEIQKVTGTTIKVDRPFVETAATGAGTVMTKSIVGQFSVLLSNQDTSLSSVSGN